MTKKNHSDNILIDNLIYQAQSNSILAPLSINTLQNMAI